MTDAVREGLQQLATDRSIRVVVLRGQAGGGFSAEAAIPVGAGPTDLTVADLDADGALDLAISAADDTITVLLSDP